jgi:catechol 2,3-dioxygenase-like lactoylglutathione lyase family enzyme
MIRGLHGLFYSSDAEATRAFMRDALKLPYTDVGGGWLIFDLPEGDIGVHPIEGAYADKVEPNTHDVSFYCDDIAGTVRDLRARGVQFKQDPQDHGYGHVTYFTMPGGVEVQLYEPKYEKRAGKPNNGVSKKAAPVRVAAKRAVKPAAKKPAAKKPAAKKPAHKKSTKRR